MMENLIGTMLGQYEIREKIGQGGMAHVFKAYQAGLDRFVAIKVLSPSLAEEPGFTERFQREAHSVARLHHPNILQVYDFGVQDKYNYLVMRYVENSRTLRHEIQDNISLDNLLDYIVQVADALNYAHKRGIIHRDVKPSNILVDGPWALLSDFGLVKMKQASRKLTSTGVGMGTPIYMSPEQASGSNIDHRTDIYALGVILHRILTGTVPHDASTPLAILVKRSTEPITPPHVIKPDIPTSLEHVVLRSLAMEPDARYSTATDFAEALKKAKTDPAFREATVTNLGDATIAAGVKTPLPSVKRRNWGLIAAGAAAAVVILVVLVFVLFSFMNSSDSSSSAQSVAQVGAAEAGAGVPVAVTETETPVPPTNTPTPIPPGTPSAIAKTNLEVRIGPGDEYDLMGYLPEGAIAEITSRDETGQWWQIKTSLISNGKGWINANPSFAEATDANNVPIALAPPTPTGTATPVPDTPTPTTTTVLDTPTSTATSTRPSATATPASSSPPTATATKAPVVSSGQFILLEPASLDEPTFGLTEFEWQWGSPLEPDQGFEVRVWREGEPAAGVHNAVLDNKEGNIQALGNNTFRLVADITNAPSVRGRGGDYLWTVLLVQISPEYKELGVQAAPPGRLRFAPPGGGGGGGDGGGGGGKSPTF
jgi:serine/threonine protein kinase